MLRPRSLRSLLCLGILLSCLSREVRADEDPALLQGQAENLIVKARGTQEIDAALALLRRALKIDQARRAQDDPELARTRRLLGLAHMQRGTAADLERAGTELHTALHLREHALRGATVEYAQALNDLATLQSIRGEDPAAEATYRRLLVLQEQVLGADALEVARTAGRLGGVYQDLGDIERAEAHYRRALTITEAHFTQASSVPGRQMPPPDEVLRYTLHLGVLAYHQGRLDEAAELLGRVKALAEERRWPERELAGLFSLLGGLAQARGLPREAAGYYHRALTLIRDERGLSGEALWIARAQAARLHLQLARFPLAESLGRQALAEAERLRGPQSREVGDLLSLIAAAAAGMGRGIEAADLLERALVLSERRLRAERYSFTEARLLSYLARLQHGEEAWIYTLLCRMKDGQPGKEALTRLALTTARLRKGRAVDEVGAASRVLFRTLGAEGGEEFAQLRSLRSQYAALSLAGPGSLSPAAYQGRLVDLLAQSDHLEETLLRRAGAKRALPLSLSGQDPLSLPGQVAAALPSDGVLVELVLFHPREMDGPQPLDPDGGEGRYLALVLQPAPVGGPLVMLARDLGPAAVVNRAARRLLRALSDRGSPRAAYEVPAAELARLVWEPLRPALHGRRAVYLSPDGALGLLPFAVLPEEGAPLLSRYQLSYLTSGRDLLPLDRPPRPAAEAVILADPDFTSSQPGPLAPLVSRPQRARSLLGWRFAPLPGTRREAEALLARFPAGRALIGEQATEAALLSVSAPGVLHVATHGLFLDEEAGGRGGRGPAGVAVPGVEVPSPTPLLRAALVLAGAEARREDEGADGLATALEVAGMDLWGTQLVVLSACDTGRGEAVPGQGVYGMRRAIMAAGAESLVTSLWRVDDSATAALMIAFYDGMLAGRGRAQALQEAAQQVRRSHPHPYYWAPFVLMGRVGPLQGLHVVRRPAQDAERPPDRRLHGVWAEGPGSVYVVGREGGLWHWDGARWRGGTGHGDGVDLNGVWGARCPCGRREVREVMVVGDGGVALRWDGARWVRLLTGTKEDLLSVWGDGPDRFYAVGRKGVALRWDGGRWHRVPTGTTMDLYGVRGTGGQLVMVGSGFTALLFELGAGGAPAGPPRVLGPPPDRLQRRNKLPALFSVSGTPTDLYAAGDGALWRWDGRRWDEVPLASLGGSLRAVAGSGADVLAVGWRAAVRFDGKSWTRLPRETRQRTLYGIAGLGVGQAVAVGDDGLVLRWGPGMGWRRLGGPPAEGEPWNFHAAWAPAGERSGPVIVAGEEGEVWQGGAAGWERLRAGTGGGESISGLWGFGEKDVYAVGPRGLLLHWDGTTWRRGESGTTRALSAIWGKGPEDLFLVGEEGTLLHGGRRGADWRFTQVPIAGAAADADLTGVWGADGKVLVVGLRQQGQALRGVVLRGDARGVRAEETGGVGPLFGVWAMDRGAAYAVGEEVVLRREGGRWRQVTGSALAGTTLHAVWGRGPGAVYAVGARSVDGVAVQIREREVLPLRVGSVPRLLALWGQGKELLVTGTGGTRKFISPEASQAQAK